MLHPSYSDLIDVVNKNVEEGEAPVVNSRYSIVIATAKRARQIIAGDEPLIDDAKGKKPLSIAVDELYSGKIQILGEEEIDETEALLEEETAEAIEASEEETLEIEEEIVED